MTAKKKNASEIAADLTTELKFIRSMVRDVGEGFILRKEGEIETLLSYLVGFPNVELQDIASPWLREARNLKVKPAKGRLKDLKKIDSLLEYLLDDIIELQHVSEISSSEKKRSKRAKDVCKKEKVLPGETLP